MNIRCAGLAALAGSVLFCCALPVSGQEEVNVQFTGGYSTTWGNYGAGVYTANINGQTSPGIICDDFNDEIYSGESWTANAYQASSLTSSNIGETLFGSNPSVGLNGYAEMAEIATMMFSFNGSASFGGITGITQAELSEAIWDIGLGGGLNSSIDTKAYNLVQALKAYFQTNSAQTYLSTLTNLWILTPAQLGPGEPQEMWTENLSVPEGGAALLYLLFAGSACFGTMFFSRRRAENRIGA